MAFTIWTEDGPVFSARFAAGFGNIDWESRGDITVWGEETARFGPHLPNVQGSLHRMPDYPFGYGRLSSLSQKQNDCG